MSGFIGWQGLLILIAIGLLVFRAKKLPGLGRSFGQGLKELGDATVGKVRKRDDGPDAGEPPSADTESSGRQAIG